MTTEPIAVVGRGCVLPDAMHPDAFWDNIAAGRLSISAVPPGRWRVDPGPGARSTTERTDPGSDLGGYVYGFEEVFDPTGFAIDVEEVVRLDRLTKWVLHAARQALREAGRLRLEQTPRAGLIMGNLSFPSEAMSGFAERQWLRAQPAEPAEALLGTLPERPSSGSGYDRFNSGRPAHLAARALGLGAGSFALDAACASSLYAIKLACDRLQDGSADLMVAGAVNCPDDLLVQAGFRSLGALSRSGRSRPFHQDADGLLAGEGAGFVALMRLSDALAEGREIHGVIRGIGLSNDGRAGGFLAPSQEGQERAMRAAYQAAGVAPETVSLVECHATGTPLGDTVELRSMGRVFGANRRLPIGSVKSNIGHVVTAAGAAGLLKVLGAMRAGLRPPTLGVDTPNAALAGLPLRLLTESEDWPGLRRAAVSAFGFGGNNAHLIVDAWDTDGAAVEFPPPVRQPEPTEPIAIVALGARVGTGRGTEDLTTDLFAGRDRSAPRSDVEIALGGLRFPPNDLRATHAQQLLALEAAREAVAHVRLPRDTTMVLLGMGADAEVARHLARSRIPSWLARLGVTDPEQVRAHQDAFGDPLIPAAVLGAMPNIVANRINAQLDLAGPSFTVSAEESSGTVALELGARALRTGAADAVVVGAVDLSHEPVHEAALADLGRARTSGDAAVVLVLKRLADARRDDERVLAVLDEASAPTPDLVVGPTEEIGAGPGTFDPAALFGHPHAAQGLLAVASAALSIAHRAIPRGGAPASPALGALSAEVVSTALDAPTRRIRLRDAGPTAWIARSPARPHTYSGRDRAEALAALAARRESDEGPARLVILAEDAGRLEARASDAAAWLSDGGRQPDDVFFRETPQTGEVAFVFAGGSMAYPGMGRELMLAVPHVLDVVESRCGPLRELADWAYTGDAAGEPSVSEQVWGSSLICQVHAELTRAQLGIRPTAVIGYSSGETAALSAMGVWSDTAAFVREARAGDLFRTALVGEITAVRRRWARSGIIGTRWRSYLVAASADEVRAALRDEPAVHLMMVNAPGSCVVGGEETRCRRVLDRLGATAIPTGYDVAAHVPELGEVEQEWRELHRRPSAALSGVRFYTGATTDWYHPDPDSAADALTGQAVHTSDFAGVIERAWQDGVRIFIEHGPRALCTKWIGETLAGREHLAVALDGADGRDLRQLSRAVGELLAAGVPMTQDTLFDLLTSAAPKPRDAAEYLTLPAHPVPVRLPALIDGDEAAEVMARAPELPVPVRGPIRIPMPAAPIPHVKTPSTTHGRFLAANARALSEAQRAYLTTQAEAHREFLRVRARAQAELLRRRPDTPAPPRPPEPARLPNPPKPPAADVQRRPGPKFTREQLEHLASARISDLFGPEFAAQDRYPKQTRLPMPPMLLVDRVTGIDAVPRSMGTGTVWTETDVRADSWYLDATGRMPAGLMVEAGQADLLLIGWLGADLVNRGERVYRLLGCDLTLHGSPAEIGDTLRFEIGVDGHGEHGGIRLFFFHYDCYVGDRLQMSVRNGQAGFFTEAELAATGGVLWDPEAQAPPAAAAVEMDGVARTAASISTRRRFDSAAVHAFADGRPADCFGPEWERTRAHVRSPRIAADRLLLFDEVTDFDPAGGPWQRGYLRAQRPIAPDDWFFAGHFLGDPCMPGTLMLEGCLQAMAFYLAALGHTIDRDGWRFEPVPGTQYSMRCRGQVIPDSERLVYEVFVVEVGDGPEPTLIADVLGTVDGVKAFHAQRIGLRLVPDWPLDHWRKLGPHVDQLDGGRLVARELGGLVGHRERGEVAVVDGFAFDYPALLAGAWGKPSSAFGDSYRVFDDTRRAPRLPGPPYHFVSRITGIGGEQGAMAVGSWVEAEYDVPDQVWYFEQSAAPSMPYCVVMEVALQPCGWLASYVGGALGTETDLLFRNLDGTAVLNSEVNPATRTIRTKATLTQLSRNGDTTIVAFAVDCHADGRPVFSARTVFGFFPATAFEDQAGLPAPAEESALLNQPADQAVELPASLARYGTGRLRLPGEMLLMLDRITGYQPSGGQAGLGRLRAEKDVRPEEWFFAAHFFQDPVQPGSLGVEAMCQLLQFALIEQGTTVPRPRFEPMMLGHEVSWKYRGQVVPSNGRILIELEILTKGTDAAGEYATAQAALWVDGTRIYQARLGMRVVPGESDASAAERAHSRDSAVEDGCQQTEATDNVR